VVPSEIRSFFLTILLVREAEVSHGVVCPSVYYSNMIFLYEVGIISEMKFVLSFRKFKACYNSNIMSAGLQFQEPARTF